jgi:PPE-repeat protein
MATIPVLVPPIWPALPPEINTSRLMAGAGPAPMVQAAAGWEALAISLEAQADELAGSLSSLASVWTGSAAEQAIAATIPMVIWLRMLSLQAMKRSMQAAAQATSYTYALATTPPIPEIEMNHITHAVLEATNFLEINRLPITLNELDYIRMWELAAAVMDAYQAETVMNTTFEPIAMPKPIVMPGVVEGTASSVLAAAGAMAPAAVMRNAVFTKVSAEGKAQSVALNTGRAASSVNQGLAHAGTEAKQAGDFSSTGQQDQMMQQGMQQGVQMATQMGSSLAQLPQQLMQGVTQPFQQMTQPLQQVSSLFGQMSGMNGKGAQVGLYGAPPFSNHPAIGGNGATSGAGLVRAASLPGAGGTAVRTPLMANLVGTPSVSPVSVTPGAAAGAAAAGLAPVGAGLGGGSPMGMLGQRSKSGGTKSGLTAPSPLPHDLAEDDEDDW